MGQWYRVLAFALSMALLAPFAPVPAQAGEAVQVISIDVKPGSDPNAINCSRPKGVIPVAILSERGSAAKRGFDARTVDASTVRFGPGDAKAQMGHLEDVNDDGALDMVLYFPAADTGIVCGATEAFLSGKTTGGMEIQGSDAIKTVP